MDFVLFERYGLTVLIIERAYDQKCWSLEISKYKWSFFDERPLFSQLKGMTTKLLTDREALKILKQYATDTVIGAKVKKFLDDYNKLPF